VNIHYGLGLAHVVKDIVQSGQTDNVSGFIAQ